MNRRSLVQAAVALCTASCIATALTADLTAAQLRGTPGEGHTGKDSEKVKITHSQMNMMPEGPFVQKIGRLLESKFPNPNQREMPADFRDKMARHAIFVARSYDLKNERDIVSFALAMLNINPSFHLQKRIHAILIQKEISGDQRLDLIISDASDADWEEAGTMTNSANYWQQIFMGPSDGTMIPH